MSLVTENTSGQLITSAGIVRPAYGFGTKAYGVAGVPTKGREAHVQFREQNSGFAPSEDYRPAEFLPGLWRDLDRNGCLVTIEGGTFVGNAAVLRQAGTVNMFAHSVMPANAGVSQKLLYTSLDLDLTLDLDTVAATSQTNVRVDSTAVSAGTTTYKVAGNKPLGYVPTHELSTAWEKVFANQKFMGQSCIKTNWLNMYPVNNVFMYGGTITKTTDFTALRASYGFGGYSVLAALDGANPGADITVTLTGIMPGDKVMPNPILPGTLISVEDFARIAVGLSAGNAAATTDVDTSGIVNAIVAAGYAADRDSVTMAAAVAYAQEHIVGRCFKRQTRATVGSQDTNAAASAGYILPTGEVLTNQDIYASTYKFMVTPPGLGLSGASTGGIEADQNSALAFAKLINGNVDVVFININVK